MAAPSENAPLSSLVSNSPSGDAVSQKPPDATLTHPSALPPSQLKTRSISGESSTPGRPPSPAILDSPQETLPALPPEHSQLGEMAGTLGGSRISPAPSPVDPIVPLSPSSQVPAPTAESEGEHEGPLATSSTPYASETFPHFIPLPESDGEEGSSSESPKVERFERTWNSGDQDRGAHTTDINERTNTPDRPDVHRITHPSEADDSQALWVFGDSVLERRDRRVHERWKAGLGVTFVLANVLSVLTLCVALELYRRTKAANPGLIAMIRARHITRAGKGSPFSPIVSLFFEVDAPFVHSNTAFLAGLCTTLACTLLSDLALRWVSRFENYLPPPSATPRDRMIARMEWNERIERRAVPWLFEIGIPGLLYAALCLFYTGAIMRAFPHLNKAMCVVFGVVFMILSIVVLWFFEPALDARFRPKPVSSTGRQQSNRR